MHTHTDQAQGGPAPASGMTSFLSRLRQGVLRFAARERDAQVRVSCVRVCVFETRLTAEPSPDGGKGWIDPIDCPPANGKPMAIASIDTTQPHQEQADVATALLLTTWWRTIALEGVEDRQALQAEAEAVEKLGGYQQTVALRKNLDEQMLRMFNAIHAARQAQCTSSHICIQLCWGMMDRLTAEPNVVFSADPAKLRELTSTPGQANAAAAAEEEEDWRPPKGTRRRRQHHDPRGGAGGGDSVVTKLLRKELGFTLRVGPSTVPAAGRGVFLEGKARIGALVGLFPGLVYLPEHLKTPEDVQALFPDPDFFLFQRSVLHRDGLMDCTIIG